MEDIVTRMSDDDKVIDSDVPAPDDAPTGKIAGAPDKEPVEASAAPSEANAKAELGNLLDDLDRYGER